MGGRRLIAFLAALGAALAFAPAAGAATIEVDVLNDELNGDSDCSLREAVEAANTNDPVSGCASGQGGSKRDTIELADEDYDLSLTDPDEDLNASGDLDYIGGGKLTIAGAGIADTQIRAADGAGVLEANGPDGATSLTLRDISIANGEGGTSGGNLEAFLVNVALTRVGVLSGLADSTGGGVSFAGEGHKLSINRSSFLANDASSGGGLYVGTDAPTEIHRTLFQGNEASGGASRGGAMSLTSPTLITDSTLFDNTTASDGGGSALGAGIYAGGGGIVIMRSLFESNQALGEDLVEPRGGALTISGEGNKVVNSTFFENTSGHEGGAIQGDVAVSHSTFFANAAAVAGDHVNNGVTVRNSIFPGASIAVDLCGPDVTSKGFNVMTYDDPDCGTLDSDVIAPGDIGFVDPDGPADNGGRTETIAIEGTSPAKNIVPVGKCKVAKGEDQRGFERPKGPGCDAGAFEFGASP